jgi:mannose-6-phosphate isomerase-like protein (cupin superfamily)
MRTAVLCVAIALVATTFDVNAQTRRKPQASKTATFAILVTDPTGTQIPNVAVSVEGPTARTARTEGGRIALENLAPGEYLIRFEKEGFIPHERQLTARAGAPIEVNVTLKPMPAPPRPPEPEEPEPSPSNAKPAAIDVPGVAEREFVGRGALKTTSLACGGAGKASLIQLNDPVADHAHAESDEFLYVVAGEGAAVVAGAAHRLRAGMLVFVPRGVTHRFSQSGRNPLIIMSTRAGEGCASPATAEKGDSHLFAKLLIRPGTEFGGQGGMSRSSKDLGER